LDKLDAQHAKRILKFLRERIAKLEDPRGLGKPLQGSQLGEFGDRGESAQPRLAVPRSELSARVGDYRLICKIEDDRLLVLVLRISHRREICRQALQTAVKCYR